MSWPTLCGYCGGVGEVTTVNELGDEFSTHMCNRCGGAGVRNFDGEVYYERTKASVTQKQIVQMALDSMEAQLRKHKNA